MLTRRFDPQDVHVGLQVHPGFVRAFDDLRDIGVEVESKSLTFDREDGVVKHHILDQSSLRPAFVEPLHLTQEPKPLVALQNRQAHADAPHIWICVETLAGIEHTRKQICT